MRGLIDVLLPLRCLVCRSPGDTMCPSCWRALPRLCSRPRCERCGAPAVWPVLRCRECSGRRLAFASARAAVAYDDGVALLVAAWKEQGLRTIAGIAADLVVEGVPAPAVDALTFVPPDRDRMLSRGHHAARRLAEKLARRWDLPVVAPPERRRNVRRQRGLRLAERRRNVAGAFAPRGRAPSQICLVDDVYTTGSTVSAAASALRSAGATCVHVVTFARAVR